MTADWLCVASYTDPRLGSTDSELLIAQAADAELRVQIARLVPWLVFEGREAIQRAQNSQQLTDRDVARWHLHRCPECGLGPYGPYTRTISQMLKLATDFH